MNHITLELPPTRANARNSEGAFVTLKSGRILFAYTKYSTGAADEASAVIAARHSDDGGATWSSKDCVLVKKEGDLNVMSVSLLRLRDGRIALLNLRKDYAPWVRNRRAAWGEGEVTCMPWIRFSKDECETFSKPTSLMSVPGYHVVNNDRVIQLKSGRIIVPIALHRIRWPSGPKTGAKPHPYLGNPAMIFFYFSDDGGESWFESVNNYYHCFPSGHGLQEPGIVELKGGRLWSWCRAGAFGIEGSKGCQWESFSNDDGVHWSESKPSQFRSPCSPMSVKRIPKTGHLLAVWNDHSGRFKLPKSKPISWGRTPLVSAISTDEGKTWKHHKLIEKAPDHGYCYIAIHFTEDAALLAYCAGGATTTMPLDLLRMRRISIDELYS